ncbi:fructokinase [Cyanidioschyzon merolae strain 10D]|jgi:fructokinase|uniref:fructokinase n=1 Tax=Cyanidioschyzon merolae (strain NIES-3377 / 10D) TaxID=280699 RepID=M1VBH3_CYAM1|nr:fructokinase [Cyanidioschyzon merolae strain 10D]BAM79667.1 fructokinase [Cyanidioschyzon merolae strain 10D]|eukprot:XP_005535953.1 fructokinase [Cyanidioschyzon merolae strain 10D]
MTSRQTTTPTWLVWAAAPALFSTVTALGWGLARWRQRRALSLGEEDERSTTVPAVQSLRNQHLVFAAIELGGTSARAAIAVGRPDQFIERFQVPTSTPRETLTLLTAWLAERHETHPITALGVATFGPILLPSVASSAASHQVRFGKTPKKAWQGLALLEELQQLWERDEQRPASQELAKAIGTRIPVLVDTDVNAPALAELAARRSPTDPGGPLVLAYVTVGTGVGVGVAIQDEPLHGRLHPEAGHIRVVRYPADSYSGSCIWHQDCLEGLCCAGALAERAKVDASQLADLADDHPVWKLAAHYLAQLCWNLSCVLAPHWIVLGGGVMQRKSLLKKIQSKFVELDRDYLGIETPVEKYIVSSAYGPHAGLVGACTLAERAWQMR